MVSIQPAKNRMHNINNGEVLYESPENFLMQGMDACDDAGTKSCSPPSNDDCTLAGRTSCSPPSNADCPIDNKTSCSPPSNDHCTVDNKTSCSPPSNEVEDQLNFENDSIAINELKKAITALQRLS